MKPDRRVRRILLVVPGGVTTDGRGDIVPGLNAFAHELATRCKVAVLALNDQPESACEISDRLTIFRPGRRKKIFLGSLSDALVAHRQLKQAAFDFDIVHSFWLGRTSFTAGVIRGRARCPWIASVAGQEIYENRLRELPPMQRGLSRWINRRALAEATLVTAGSRFLADQIAAYGRSAYWWPLFPELRQFMTVDSRHRVSGGPFRLITVADHNRAKDVTTMLRTIKLLAMRGNDVHLDWIGLDLESGGARAEAERLGISARVRFHGHRPHSEIARQLGRAQLYVQSSRYESQGVSVCEAAASGLPIVGTAVGILAEIAPTGAVAVPPESPAALADAITVLIDDDERRRSLGEGARQWIGRYSLDRTVSQALEFYEIAIECGTRGKFGLIS